MLLRKNIYPAVIYNYFPNHDLSRGKTGRRINHFILWQTHESSLSDRKRNRLPGDDSSDPFCERPMGADIVVPLKPIKTISAMG